jgi:hypothetical protein
MKKLDSEQSVNGNTSLVNGVRSSSSPISRNGVLNNHGDLICEVTVTQVVGATEMRPQSM